MKRMLLKSLLIISFLLITFFSLNRDIYAASFAYKDFNWEEFSKQNRNYFVAECNEDDKDCESKVLAVKKRFYTRLYYLLAKVQQKYGTIIDDNIIITTLLLGYGIDDFIDPETTEESAYKLDDDDSSPTKDSYIGGDDGNKDAAKLYFEDSKDSLKLLINNFIGYRLTCYGVSNEVPEIGEDSTPVCNNDLIPSGNKCLGKIKDYKGSFFESIGIDLIEPKWVECNKLAINEGYKEGYTESSGVEEVSSDFYYNFLEESTFLDERDVLRDYYYLVLNSLNKKSMKELTTDEYKEYKDEIIEARKEIIEDIKEKVKNYEGISEKYNKVSSTQYWWPIGSDETSEVDGAIMATGEPARTGISSRFGIRSSGMHKGLDIPGSLGVTNVIATKDGIVVYSSLSANINCEDNGDGVCNNGYGNYVIIEHIDGNYSLYAHLSKGTVTVEVGESVKQGQVVGKVGHSGRSSGPHLHFEIRVGSNDSTSTQDPLNFISPTNPRPFGGTTEFLEWLGHLEGTGPMDGDYYKVYKDSSKKLTFGHGIAIIYNKEILLSNGINPDNLMLGSLIPKSIADSIFQKAVDVRANTVKALLAKNNVVLNENQFDALLSLYFNCGSINDFFGNYQSYGSTEALCENWWNDKAIRDHNKEIQVGLIKRRKAECDLFVNGVYNMNVYR